MELITPEELKKLLPSSPLQRDNVMSYRNTIKRILSGNDKRLLAIVGPCSIHETIASGEYALKLKSLSDKLSDKLFIVMRVYFEKPRTSTGWKGFLNDPHLDGSLDVNEGIIQARKLLLSLADMEMPAGGEILSPASPLYFNELYSWNSIGARTSESQTHRDIAAGLDYVVGFKNNTDGNIDIAVNAMLSATQPGGYIGYSQKGKVSLIKTRGNHNIHLILRGGKKPNYHSEIIKKYSKELKIKGLPDRILIDCSHGNSNRNAGKQADILSDIAEQIKNGNNSIFGFMLESFLNYGKQDIPFDISTLKYGVSVTDECLDWNSTEKLLTDFYERID
ncbi:MAG: 3-deoxy-7-phosphoheptulonate synthase [Chlorobi bacterium]|nr:3-deoxy-7-phosphoheptulonate synthase [Chlorobiota bacterium]